MTPRLRLRRLSAAIAMALVLGAAAPSAQAALWVVDPAASRLEITYRENGEPQPGTFSRFSGEGEFDPARPGAATLTLVFETASIELADRFRSEFVQSEAWFDSRRFPEARFDLDRLEPLGDDLYRAVGTLTIKDVSRAIEIDLTLRVADGRTTAEGAVGFDRIDFRLGDTTGGFLIDIGRQIDVRFALTAVER